jgi:hypothetical protein
MKKWGWMEAAAASLLIGFLVLLTVRYGQLPDEVPVHFNFAGDADSQGPKYLLWVVAGLMVLLYAALTYLARKPEWFNYPVEITEQNRAYQTQNLVLLVNRMKLAIVAAVGLPILQSTNLALGLPSGFFPSAMLALVGLLLGLVIYHLFRAFRLA